MDIKKYENKMPYPERLKKPYLNHTHTSEEVARYAEDLKVYEASLLKYTEERHKYVNEENRLHELFKQDALKELGLEKHPKKEVLWNIAWEYGHSSGMKEVWIEMETLSELLS